MQPTVRAYRPTDLDAVYDICVRTAANGLDGRGKYTSDRLVGDIFAAPYVTHEPQFAYVVDDGEGRAIGYILGTADTAAFVRWYRAEWLPAHPYPPSEQDAPLLRAHENPERMLTPALVAYPAHLHIDLLPETQGKGLGRSLMAAFLEGLAEAGVPAVHLEMAKSNTGARAFYDRLGFHEIDVPGTPDTQTVMGRETAESRP